MRVDLHVELHHVENRRPADSAPCFAGLGRFSFNWQGPLRKMSKVVDPRDTKALFGGIPSVKGSPLITILSFCTLLGFKT